MNLLELILLALAAAVYPPLLTGVILILGRPNPLRMLIAFLIGGLAISIAAGIVIVAALHTSGAADPHSNAHPVADIAIGSLSLLLAWAMATHRINGGFLARRRQRHPRPSQSGPSFTERALGSGSMLRAGLAGLALSLPGMWYLAALTGVAESHSSTGVKVLQILLFNAIMFALVELPIIGYLIDPERTGARVARLRTGLREHARTIGVLVATVVGIWLLVKGAVNLGG